MVNMPEDKPEEIKPDGAKAQKSYFEQYAKKPYPGRDKEYLKRLAFDCMGNLVCCTWLMPMDVTSEELAHTFIPLAFLSGPDYSRYLKKHKIEHFFAHAVNQVHPITPDLRFGKYNAVEYLTVPEAETVINYMQSIQDFMKQL